MRLEGWRRLEGKEMGAASSRGSYARDRGQVWPGVTLGCRHVAFDVCAHSQAVKSEGVGGEDDCSCWAGLDWAGKDRRGCWAMQEGSPSNEIQKKIVGLFF